MTYNYYYKDLQGVRHLITAPAPEDKNVTTIQGSANDMQEISRHITVKQGSITKKYIYKLASHICRDTLKTCKMYLGMECNASIKDVGVVVNSEAEYDEAEDTVAIIATMLVVLGIGAIFLGITPLAALLICLGLLIFVAHLVNKI